MRLDQIPDEPAGTLDEESVIGYLLLVAGKKNQKYSKEKIASSEQPAISDNYLTSRILLTIPRNPKDFRDSIPEIALQFLRAP